MGQIIMAVCENCGFKKEFLFGAGMRDFTRVCSVPAIDKETGEFVVSNYFRKRKSVKLVFYNQKEMSKSSSAEGHHSWGQVVINEKFNLCPYCKSFTLRFESIGLFD